MKPASDNQVYASLKEAIALGEIRPVFQPIVEIDGRRLIGFEVLARWDSPTLGSVSPATFIPYAEKSDLINDLSNDIIRRSCNFAAQWQGNFCLFFNISAGQFQSAGLHDLVVDAVKHSGFPLNRIVLEMTERDEISKPDKAHATIRKLLSDGIRLSIDDFLTGYNDLARLQEYPFSYIKLDSNLTALVTRAESCHKSMSAILEIGQKANCQVIVEGIETEEQARAVAALGCHLGQGWLFSYPLRPEDASVYASSANIPSER